MEIQLYDFFFIAALCHSRRYFIHIYILNKKRKVSFWWCNLSQFSLEVDIWDMKYCLITAIFHVGLCHKFRDQSSVKGLSRQWVEFQKVRAGRIFTTKMSICVDRRYLYFFPDRKSTKSRTNSYALERNSVQKMVGFVLTECWKRKHRTKTVLPLVNGYFHHTM